MKYCEDSTAEGAGRRRAGRAARRAGAGCEARGSGRVGARYGMRGSRVRLQNTKTRLCQIICSKSVYIALKTSISCRLFDLGVFFAPDLADYLT